MNQRSKRHHEVPKWLLKTFCVGGSKSLWVGFCSERKVAKRHIKKVHYRHDGNTRTDYLPDGSGGFKRVKSDRDEQILAKFDDQASNATKELLRWARRHHRTGEAPFHLPEAVVNPCKSTIVTQARRTHKSQDTIGLTAGFEGVWWDSAYIRAKEEGFQLGPREELARDPRFQALISDAKQNQRANFASGDHPILQDKETRFLLDTGLGVGVLPQSGPRLVVGDRGITDLEQSGKVVSYLPLAPDVVIYLTARPGSVTFVSLCETFAEVHNRCTTKVSLRIAGVSKREIAALLEARDGR